jgi:hypothetical protein
MEAFIALLGVPGSPLVARVAKHLDQSKGAAHCLSLDAPFSSEPVTVAPGTVSWQGIELRQAAAVLVEQPLFPWPQPGLLAQRPQAIPPQEWLVFEREARSLAISAIAAAAEHCPVINHPSAAHLAVSPSIALDRLAEQGVSVHPWRLAPAPDSDDSRLMIDASGRDRWHSPEPPVAGEPALIWDDPPAGEVHSLLVVGSQVVGGQRYPSLSAWTSGAAAEPVTGSNQAAQADLACHAAAALGLELAAVTVTAGPSPAVILVAAGPDLAEWDTVLGGRLAPALAAHLTTIAGAKEGASR